MKRLGTLAAVLSLLSGCATPTLLIPTTTITSVIPSATGIPNSVALSGNFEFVSIQGAGQIVTYNISSGSQVLASAYTTPCKDPSGMVVASIGAANIMAVACYDTASLLTLTIHSDGSLTALGSVGGLPLPYPGIALDGTNVFVPLFGHAGVNGSVAKVSIAAPATPVVTAIVSLASPAPGQYVDPSYLAIANGYIYAVAGSESTPQDNSSTLQVIAESSMTLTGSPFIVAHSPQAIAIQGNVLYTTLFDASQLESIDISNPASLRALEIVPLASAKSSCHALPIAIVSQTAYVGCYDEAQLEQVDLTDPANMRLTQIITGVPSPQRILPTGQFLLVPSSVAGGHVYQIATHTSLQ